MEATNMTVNSLKRSRQSECVVCEVECDSQSLHFGQPTCRACAAFFRRSVSQKLRYFCQRNGDCEIDKGARNTCRACRLHKCLAQGMQPSAVQNSREIAAPGLFLPPLTTSPAAVSCDQQFKNNSNNGSNEYLQPKQSPTSTTSTCSHGLLEQSSPSAPPPQYKHLGRMREGLHQFWSLLKAVQTMAQEEEEVYSSLTSTTAMAGIAMGQQRPRSRFESAKRICKMGCSLMVDTVERFCWPFNELSMEEKRKMIITYTPLYCNSLRAYVTSKEFGPGDDRLVMPDGGYVQLSQLHLFFKDSKLVTGDPEQVARIFHNAIQYLLINVVGHMRNIDMQEMESVAMVGMFLWADSPELSSATLQLAQQVRNEIIIDLHHFYRSLGLTPEEITLKTANLFLLIPKVEAVVKMMLEDASLSDLFNLVTVDEASKGHVVV